MPLGAFYGVHNECGIPSKFSAVPGRVAVGRSVMVDCRLPLMLSRDHLAVQRRYAAGFSQFVCSRAWRRIQRHNWGSVSTTVVYSVGEGGITSGAWQRNPAADAATIVALIVTRAGAILQDRNAAYNSTMVVVEGEERWQVGRVVMHPMVCGSANGGCLSPAGRLKRDLSDVPSLATGAGWRISTSKGSQKQAEIGCMYRWQGEARAVVVWWLYCVCVSE